MNILDYKTISVEDIVFDTPMKTKNNAYISKAYLKNAERQHYSKRSKSYRKK